MADESGNAPAAPADASPETPTPAPAKKLAPIPPAPIGQPQGKPPAPVEKHEDRERDEKGRYTAEEALAGEDVDPHDLPRTTLDGMPSEEEDAPAPKVTRKDRIKDIFSPVIEGSPAETALATAEEEPGKEGAEEAGAEAQPATPPTPDGTPTVPTKIHMFGRDWDSQEQLDQEWRTYTGRYKKTQQLEEAAQANAKSAAAWKDAYEKLQAVKGSVPSDPKNGAGPPPVGAKPVASGDEHPLDTINWDSYNYIRENNGEAAATLWAVEEAIKKERANFNARFDELTRPSKEHAELQQNAFQAGETMAKLDSEYPGQFPEFSDEVAVSELGQFFQTKLAEGVPWAYLKSPRGVYETVLAHRAWRSEIGRPLNSSASPAPAPPTKSAVQQAVESVRAANPTLSGRSAPLRSAPTNEAAGQKVKRAILGTHVTNDLGWSE